MIKMLKTVCSKVNSFVQKNTKTLKVAIAAGVAGAMTAVNNAWATDPTPAMPVDATYITTSVSGPFVAAITFSIGAIALLKVIGWIKAGLRK